MSQQSVSFLESMTGSEHFLLMVRYIDARNPLCASQGSFILSRPEVGPALPLSATVAPASFLTENPFILPVVDTNIGTNQLPFCLQLFTSFATPTLLLLYISLPSQSSLISLRRFFPRLSGREERHSLPEGFLRLVLTLVGLAYDAAQRTWCLVSGYSMHAELRSCCTLEARFVTSSA